MDQRFEEYVAELVDKEAYVEWRSEPANGRDVQVGGGGESMDGSLFMRLDFYVAEHPTAGGRPDICC